MPVRTTLFTCEEIFIHVEAAVPGLGHTRSGLGRPSLRAVTLAGERWRWMDPRDDGLPKQRIG